MKRSLICLFALMLVLSLNMMALAEGTLSTSLTDAKSAYRAAHQSTSLAEYEAELTAMVAAGTLTREQADLLLTDAKETNALLTGVCPECGYQFQTGMNTGRGHGFGRGSRITGHAAMNTSDNTSDLDQARAAYAAGKQAGRMAEYEAELTAMAAAGTLTQEQADLLLSAAKEAEALADGTCPSCGYQFQTVTADRGMPGRHGMNQSGRGAGNGKGLGGRH